MSQLEKASKLLSYILRHKPEALNIKLDKEGWASIEELVANTKLHSIPLTENLIFQVVEQDEKGRYELNEYLDEVRAVQGHSTAQVDVTFPTAVPPVKLYHGTAITSLESIRRHGLVSPNRHYVHLSVDIDTAMSVGKRHGHPVVIAIDCKKMLAAGHKFYLAPNGVWLVESVPIEFLIYSVTG